MNPKALSQLLSQGQVPNILLLHGPEEYVKDRALARLQAEMLPAGLETLNCRTLDGARVTADQILDDCAVLPLMAQRRLVVVRDWAPLMPTKKEEEEAEEEGEAPGPEAFDLPLERVPDHCCLVFLCRGVVPLSRGAARKLAKAGAEVRFDLLKGQQGVPWVLEMARDLGKEISRFDAGGLLSCTDGTLLDAWQQMQKLAAYARGEVITHEDIEAVVAPTTEYNIFRLADHLATGRVAQALTLYRQVTDQEDSPYGLLALLSKQLATRMWAVSRAREGFVAIEEIAEMARVLGSKEFVVEAAVRQAGRTDLAGLREAVAWCADTDRDIKAGLCRQREAVELLVLRIAQRLGSKPSAPGGR